MSDRELEEKVDSEKSFQPEDDDDDEDRSFSDIESEAADEGDFEPAMSAMPPSREKFDLDAQVEVSNSPAFQCLDEVFQQGKLTGTEVAELKARYMELYDYLKRSRENEFSLLQQSKTFTTELEHQQVTLNRADEFPDNINTEVGRMREQMLKAQNSIMASEERGEELLYKVETLKEEKRLLEREYARMPKAEEIEKRKKALQEANDELVVETDRSKREAKRLRENLREAEEQGRELNDQVDTLRFQIDDLKAELLGINSVPTQLAKESDKLRKIKVELEKSLKEKENEYNQLRDALVKCEKKLMLLEEEIAELHTSALKEKEGLIMVQESFDRINRDLEVAKEKELTLISDKAALDLNFRHLALEKRNVHESHTRRLRERDREVRSLKKAQLQLRVVEEGVNIHRQMFDKTKAQFDSSPKADTNQVARKKKLKAEYDQTKKLYDNQSSLSLMEQVKIQQSIQEEERLLYELSDLRIEVVELTRLAAIKADEREQKARDFMRAEMRYHRAVEDLRSKQLQIQDHKKKLQELQVKLRDFAKLYDIIKTERNKCVNLIQTTTQKASELREKLRILHNEVEILRSGLSGKEKQLAKQRMKQSAAVVMRDTLRNEICRANLAEANQREKREQLQLDMQRLNLMVNSAEESMVQLRKTSDRAVQHRNDRAVQLIERNEEVYVLQEKVKIQDSMIRNGEIEMQGREDEINFLRRTAQELRRSVEIIWRQLPSKRNLENELATVQIQLSMCQDRMLDMEDQAENPQEHGRVRMLEGADLSPVELQGKLETLERRLASKEEQLLERELLYDAVSRLVEQVQMKAMSGRDDTLKLAKNVNGFKSQMNRVTKRMKATTAELTMYMAEALKLQQEVKEKEFHLEQCYRQMEKEEPPSPEIESEWRKLIEHTSLKQRDMDLAVMRAEEEAQYQLPGGGSTTADPRPNAYIPDDEAELPIPRPYGAHAPFRPTEPGTNMRHIRRPKLKPIEI